MQIRRVDEVALVFAAMRDRPIGRWGSFRKVEEEFHRVKRYLKMFVHAHQVVVVTASAGAHGQINSFGIVRRFVVNRNRC